MVFDTLFGMDSDYQMQPQMLEGFSVEDDGKRWKLTLRDGLLWHDGEKVPARDCVASIRRWAARDGIGSLLMARTDELAAIDDKTFQFRLKKPFAHPALRAGQDLDADVRDDAGAPGEHGSVQAGQRNGRQRSVPLQGRRVGVRLAAPSTRSSTAMCRGRRRTPVGPPAARWCTSNGWSGAPAPTMAPQPVRCRSGEMDWWELPTADLLPLLKRTGKIRVEIKDRNGTLGFMKMNNLQPPFNNAAIRRALLGAVVQSDYMTAIAGEDRTMWRDGVGIFTPGTDMGTDAGMEVLTSPRDMAKVRAAIKEAGYNSEKTVLLAPNDPHYRKAMADVGAGMLKDAGFNLDVQSVDWGTAIVRRESKQPVDKGGWSALFTTANGLDMQTPMLHFLRTTGEKAWFGWTKSARIEELRAAWVDAPDLAAQKAIAADIQRQCWIDVPHLPVGIWYQPMAWQKTIDGVPDGFPLFWGVRRVG